MFCPRLDHMSLLCLHFRLGLIFFKEETTESQPISSVLNSKEILVNK